MVKIIFAPEEYQPQENDVRVFLAGTIDNGNSIDWQVELIKYAEEKIETGSKRLVIFNPRRKNWNPNPSKEELDEQIEWELNAQDKSDYIIMNILGTSKSPITLLELGLYHEKKGLVVFCPPEFYRYENVRVTCEHFGVKHYSDYDIDTIKKYLNLIV